jgi:phytol kinase
MYNSGMNLLISVIVVLTLICISELLWRIRDINTEYTRKFVHISAGTFVAFWSLYLSRYQILLLSIAFVLVVVISRYTNLFKAIHSVQRPTWGELLFAAAVGLLAFVADSHWIYSVALLIMSIADGMAAIIGMKFGKSNRYNIFGYAKSVAGTLTFFLVSMVILIVYAIFTPGIFSVWFIGIALAATALENISIRGLDNLFVPLLVAVMLNAVR